MKLAFWIAAVPALLGSSAAMAGGMAAGLSIGGSVIKMPTGQNGILTSGDVTVTGDSEPLIYAPSVGLNIAAGLGKWGEYDAFAGLNLFATYGSATSSMTQNFSGIGTVYIPGLSLPDAGSIVVGTSQGGAVTPATAGFDVDNDPPTQSAIDDFGSGSTAPAGGAQTVGRVTVADADEAFIIAGLNTTGDGSALAYGGIADPTGSLLIITGDLAGLSISTNTTTSVLYAGGDMTVGVSKAQDEATSLQAYAGPSYRYIGQWTTTQTGATSLTVDIPEVTGVTDHPLWIQDTIVSTSLNSHYFGGVVGAGISRQIADGTSIALGAEASMYYLQSYMNGRGSVSTEGGIVPVSPPVTVDQDPVNVVEGTIAYAVRAQASASFDVADNATLTFAGTVDYLSQVARPYAGAAISTSGGTVSWSSADADNTLISFGDMFAFTGTVTLNGHF